MRISDWSSDVCSSDLVENRTSPTSWFCTISSVVNGFDAVAVRGDTAARTESRKTTNRSPRGSLMLHMPDVDVSTIRRKMQRTTPPLLTECPSINRAHRLLHPCRYRAGAPPFRPGGPTARNPDVLGNRLPVRV